jgi:hypothetical protein
MGEVISEEYRRQQMELHKNPNYGVASLMYAPIVADLIRMFNFRSVSDYGAGKQNLLKGLTEAGITGIEYFPYDPAFPEYGEPRMADVVCCIDVLEHIEPPLLNNVLAELQRIVSKIGFFTVHTGAAVKVLPDGRNAHLIQEPSSWWLKRLTDFFEVRHLQTLPNATGFWLVVEKKKP